MKKCMKKFVAAVLTAAITLSVGMPAFAGEESASSDTLSAEAIAFLEEHGVDPSIFETTSYTISNEDTIFSNAYNESVLSLKEEAIAYNFTDEQIQDYIKGLVSTPVTVVRGPNDPIDTIDMYAANRPDDNGIGYEVKSNSGYYQETAYAILPTVNRAASSGTYSDAYLFYTVSGGGNWCIDIGLAYNSGNGGEGWRGFYMPMGGKLESNKGIVTSIKAGSKVYFNARIDEDKYLHFQIVDGNNFDTVYYNIAYYVGDQKIYRTNAAFNRQITLCNGAKNFKTGAYVKNAAFNNAYIYSSSGYKQTVAANTVSNRRGVFGTNSTNAKQVTVNSYTPWYAESVSIQF